MNWINVEYQFKYEIPKEYSAQQAPEFVNNLSQAINQVIAGYKDVVFNSGSTKGVFGNINSAVGRTGDFPSDSVYEGIKPMAYRCQGQFPSFVLIFSSQYNTQDMAKDRDKLVNIESDLMGKFGVEPEELNHTFFINNGLWIKFELTLLHISFEFINLVKLYRHSPDMVKQCFGVDFVQLWNDVKKKWPQMDEEIKRKLHEVMK